MNSSTENFIPASVSEQTLQLEQELQALLESSQAEAVKSLKVRRRHGDAGSLTLALVGNYNAGKSTIISALTGRRDIPIDANVCTDIVTAYRWHDLLILDTPGVQAGMPDHDVQTEKALLDSDLLVFVITTELFSDVSADYFRRLVFGKGKADQTVLVVNKSSLDGGSPEVKRPGIDAVCTPRTSLDFGTNFIDARSYIDSLEATDERDRRELRDLSGFNAFVETLNRFVLTRCDTGRLASPLQRILEVARQARALVSVDSTEESIVVEFIGRLVSVRVKSRNRLREAVKGALSEVEERILDAGNDFADEVVEGATEQGLKAEQGKAEKAAKEAAETLGRKVTPIIEAEVEGLKKETDLAFQSKLGQEALKVLELSGIMLAAQRPDVTSPEVDFDPKKAGIEEDGLSRLRVAFELARGAKQGGDMLGKLAVGSGGSGTALLKAGEVAGSQLHQAVYEVGKFFGMNFKPWEAVNAAKFLGNLGKVVGAAGAVLNVILEIVEEVRLREQQQKLLECRSSIRSGYTDVARQVREEFWKQFDEFSAIQFDHQIDGLEGFREKIVQQQRDRRAEASLFKDLEDRAVELLGKIELPQQQLNKG